jgi:hypothetical protein
VIAAAAPSKGKFPNDLIMVLRLLTLAAGATDFASLFPMVNIYGRDTVNGF